MRKTKYKFLLRRYLPFTKTLLAIIGIGFVIYFINTTVVNSQRFKIKSFKYSGVVKFVDAQDFEKIVNANVLDQNIFKLDAKALEESLKRNFLGINTVKVHKRYFDELNIQVQERVPMAIVVDKIQTKYLIDIDGYVLGLVEDSYFDLPNLNYDDTLNIGQFVDSKIVPITMEIINEAKIEQVQVSSVSFKSEHSMFYAGQSTPVYMNKDANIKDSLKIVARLQAKAVLENKNIAKIDLRYDKVIVLYY